MIVTSTLIATSNGAVLSSVQERFPITATERSMTEVQDSALCGFTSFAPASGRPGPAIRGPTASTAPSTRLSPSGATIFIDDVYTAEVVGLYYAQATGVATWSLRFSNTSENPIGLSYLPDNAVISDGMALQCRSERTGPASAPAPAKGPSDTAIRRTRNTLAPGKFAQLNFSSAGSKDFADAALTLTMEMIVTPDTKQTDVYSVRSLGFFDVVPILR
jgi:hypothetical protein